MFNDQVPKIRTPYLWFWPQSYYYVGRVVILLSGLYMCRQGCFCVGRAVPVSAGLFLCIVFVSVLAGLLLFWQGYYCVGSVWTTCSKSYSSVRRTKLIFRFYFRYVASSFFQEFQYVDRFVNVGRVFIMSASLLLCRQGCYHIGRFVIRSAGLLLCRQCCYNVGMVVTMLTWLLQYWHFC